MRSGGRRHASQHVVVRPCASHPSKSEHYRVTAAHHRGRGAVAAPSTGTCIGRLRLEAWPDRHRSGAGPDGSRIRTADFADGTRPPAAVKMGDKTEALVREALVVLARNRKAFPKSIRFDEAVGQSATIEQLRPRSKRIAQLAERLRDTELALGASTARVARQDYSHPQVRQEPGSGESLPVPVPPLPAQAPRQVRQRDGRPSRVSGCGLTDRTRLSVQYRSGPQAPDLICHAGHSRGSPGSALEAGSSGRERPSP